jgi:two-component system KDP operon response regulator KdpE
MQGKKVLVIDDNPDLLKLAKVVFSHAQAQVYTAADGPEGLRQFYDHQPDLVILDLMLPDMDGWDVCRRIRQFSKVPLIMLTALDQDEDIIRGLTIYGADDYITKPVGANILLARAQALLRRVPSSPANKEPHLYNDNYLTMPRNERRVYIEGKPVKLSTTEYQLLYYLVQNAGRVLTFQQILDHVWGESRDNTEYVHVYIWHLRQKLEVDPRHPIYILTEYGVGYYFEKQMPGHSS